VGNWIGTNRRRCLGNRSDGIITFAAAASHRHQSNFIAFNDLNGVTVGDAAAFP